MSVADDARPAQKLNITQPVVSAHIKALTDKPFTSRTEFPSNHIRNDRTKTAT
ncbi:LysR family transcriptional regulator [Chelativorans alearense]|uniref:LysR family transcriptional regulator n=1 Tax=Chelativorans alearense TaxID=2681495 RepID=UPI0013D54568|nr:LysR family transcriptional regulator [Chelativorans alearense]